MLEMADEVCEISVELFSLSNSMHTLSWQDFESVELRVGTIIRVEDFPEARKSAYKLWVDFG